MLSLAPGVALLYAAILLVAVAFGARLSAPGVAIGNGAFRALLVGAAAMVVVGGVVELRSEWLAAREAGGVELASWMMDDPTWLVLVPVLALGTAILSVSVRQLLRGKVQGAAGWVGAVILLGALALEESAGHLWLDGETHRLHVRRGTLFVREAEVGAGEVEEVRVHTERVRGAPLSRVRLAGASLPESFRALGYDSRDAHLARVEAGRWAAAGGWVVREDEAEGAAEAEVGAR